MITLVALHTRASVSTARAHSHSEPDQTSRTAGRIAELCYDREAEAGAVCYLRGSPCGSLRGCDTVALLADKLYCIKKKTTDVPDAKIEKHLSLQKESSQNK